MKCQRETPGIHKLYKRKAVRSVFFVHFFSIQRSAAPGLSPSAQLRWLRRCRSTAGAAQSSAGPSGRRGTDLLHTLSGGDWD